MEMHAVTSEPARSDNPYETLRSGEEPKLQMEPSNARLVVAIGLSLIAGLATFIVSFFLHYNL